MVSVLQNRIHSQEPAQVLLSIQDPSLQTLFPGINTDSLPPHIYFPQNKQGFMTGLEDHSRESVTIFSCKTQRALQQRYVEYTYFRVSHSLAEGVLLS